MLGVVLRILELSGGVFGVIFRQFGVMFGSWAAICGSRSALGAQSGEIFSPTPLFWRPRGAPKKVPGGYVSVLVCFKTFDRVLVAKSEKKCKKVDDLGSPSGAKNGHFALDVSPFRLLFGAIILLQQIRTFRRRHLRIAINFEGHKDLKTFGL